MTSKEYKITSYPLEPIQLANGLNLLSIASQSLYWKLIDGLTNEREDVIVSQKDKMLALAKAVLFIGDLTSPFDMDKIYAREISKTLQEKLDEQDLRELMTLSNEIKNRFMSVIFDNNLPLTIPLEFSVTELIKAQKVGLDSVTNGSFFDKIEDIVNVAGEFSESRLMIVTNIHLVLDCAQIDYLHQLTKSHELVLISLNLTPQALLSSKNTAHEIFIDEDFVQFGSD